jgi:RNA polymerase sigma-70 factor (subfamily 1)
MYEAEDSLLECATRGEAAALSTLLKRHGPEVARKLKVGDKWRSVLDPDDVMQITYVEAFLRIGEFRPRGPKSFRSWLRQIAANNLRDAIRGFSRDKRPPPKLRLDAPGTEDSVAALYELLGVTSTTPSRVVEREEAVAMLESAIRELPRDYATVVRLHHLEGMTGPAVANVMGRSRGAVFMLLARAHDRLREILGPASQYFSSRGL